MGLTQRSAAFGGFGVALEPEELHTAAAAAAADDAFVTRLYFTQCASRSRR